MNNSYSAISLPIPSTYHHLNDPLQRYGSGDDLDIFGIVVSRSSVRKQMSFVRNVFLITSLQFLVVLGMTFLLVRIDPVFQWLQDSKYAWWVPLVPAVFIFIIAAWQLWMRYFQLTSLGRVSLLSIFTFFMALTVSDLVSKLWYNDGLLVMTMTLFGFIAVILYTLQNQYQFSGAKAILMTCVGICLSSPWLRRVFDKDPLEILWPMVQAIIVCSYFVLELYYTMASVTVDDYILANICFYIDLLYPMRCLHNLCELTDDVEVFPDILRPGPDS